MSDTLILSSSAEISSRPAAADRALNFFTANTFRRFLALGLDHLVYGIFYLPVSIQAWFSYFRSGYMEVEWRLLILCFVLQFFFRVSFLRFLGATPAKLFFGLRIVNRHTGGELSWPQALIRVLTEHLSFFFGNSFLLLAFLRLDRTHLADWLAETRVVQLTPRLKPPHRRILFGLAFFVYLFFTGFRATYQQVKGIEMNSRTILFSK